MSSGMAIIADGLTKRYGKTTVLDAVDLRVPAGSVFGLLGHNGADKTTSVLLVAVFLPLSARRYR
ncbi:MAG: hypothetical protein ACRDTA_21510 [Pseudonocardiaceae bacterium]